MIRAMYEDATMTVKVNGKESNAFNVRVRMHRGWILSTILLFIILLEALSREFR